MWIIEDWAGNTLFGGYEWATFEEAESYLSEFLGETYDEDRQEYYIVEAKA